LCKNGLFTSLALVASLAFASCAKKTEPQLDSCVQGTPSITTGSTGTGLVFVADPEASSGVSSLSPSSLKLDEFRSEVKLDRLGGRGVLEGQYADIRNGLSCDHGFGAYDVANRFHYSHADSRFQETMSYYYADTYLARLDEIGYLSNRTPVKVVAHCMLEDNAFYFRSRVDGQVVGNVCLGDSYYTRGASYADDASVTVHELQHGATTDAYDLRQSLNRFWYDEAGALNEAVSDFMAMSFLEPMLPAAFDPRTFSRWALGSFIPGEIHERGMYRCPAYDSRFSSECSGFPGFSGPDNIVSYVYPDGLGWPFPKNYEGPAYAAEAFNEYGGQEEIHNAGMVLEGALWDVHVAVRNARGGDARGAHLAVMKLLLESIKHLPKPREEANQLSPVTFRELAQWMVDLSSEPAIGMSPAEQSAVASALTARGLFGGPLLPSGWAEVGPGIAGVSAGVRIHDNPIKLKRWLASMGSEPAQVTQGVSTGLNGQLDRGETVAIWFDVANNAAISAGGLRITVTTPDADAVQILDDYTNIGASGPGRAQLMYGKVYGRTVVEALAPASSPRPSYNVPAGTSYFRTNPHYDRSFTTALWVKVSPTAASGRTVRFSLEILPSNGPAVSLDFPVRIN
jgi:hypothetical protein